MNVSLLLSLVLQDEDLSKLERRAFESMQRQLEQGRSLSPKQETWIRDIGERLGVEEAPAANLFSQMPKDKQLKEKEDSRTKLPWEQPGYVKVLKPPGRRA